MFAVLALKAVVGIIGVVAAAAATLAVAESGLGGDRAVLERDGVTGVADTGVG